jgi:hypothetical protein
MDPAQTKSSVDNGAEERERLVSTLPIREGFWKPYVLYRGFWVSPQVAKSVMLLQDEFKPRADDIILAACPKSGTTWLKALAFTLVNRSRHAVAGDADGHPLLTNSPHDLVPFIEKPDRELYPVAELEALASPRLLATHMPFTLLPPSISAVGCRVVYISREPKDVLVSLWHYLNSVSKDYFIKLEKAFELFSEGGSYFGPVWDHYLGYWKQSIAEPDRVLFLKYEEMMADPVKHVKTLAEFLGVPFTVDEVDAGAVEQVVDLCSFQKLKNLPVNSSGTSDLAGWMPMEKSSYFRNGTVGDSANHLTQEMAHKLDCIVQEKLKGSGLAF